MQHDKIIMWTIFFSLVIAFVVWALEDYRYEMKKREIDKRYMDGMRDLFERMKQNSKL